LAQQLVWDYRQCDLSERDRALCDYAVKLTRTPGQMDQQDVERLRQVGLTDAQVTITVQVISYFNYINRIADGLGVDLEPFMKEIPKDQWLNEKGKFV
jgi:uncharacterized peroxidase-related enzyme